MTSLAAVQEMPFRTPIPLETALPLPSDDPLGLVDGLLEQGGSETPVSLARSDPYRFGLRSKCPTSRQAWDERRLQSRPPRCHRLRRLALCRVGVAHDDDVALGPKSFARDRPGSVPSGAGRPRSDNGG